MRLSSSLYLLPVLSLHALLVIEDTTVSDSPAELAESELCSIDSDRVHETLNKKRHFY